MAGRPRAVINWDDFDRLCAIQCTIEEIAAFFRLNESTVRRAVRREKREVFEVYAAARRDAGKASLRRTMWQKALKGDNVMAIFLAKNHLGMADRQSHEVTGKDGAPIAIDLEDLRDRLTRRLVRLVATN